MTTKRTIVPARAAGLRTSLRQTREPSAGRARAAASSGGASVPMDMRRSPHPDLRVQVDVEEIHGEVHDDDDHREDEHARLDDGEVELADRADDEPAHAGHREDSLGDDGAGEEEAELQP